MSLENICKDYMESSENIIVDRCKDKGCKLKGVSNKQFLIFKADEIEKSKRNPQPKKSVDCILIERTPIEEDSFRIILCELTKSSKNLNDIREKFKNSAYEIFNKFEEHGLKVYSISYLYLGKTSRSLGYKIINQPLDVKFDTVKDDLSHIISAKRCDFDVRTLKV